MSGNDEVELSEVEAEQYDRQIRLWGLESQKRLRASKLLIIGLSGLGAEIAKNVILSGVKSVCLLDKENLQELDFYSQFLAPQDKIGVNRAEASLQRAKALNPMVEVIVETKGIDDLPDTFFTSFDIVCATGLTSQQLIRINNICRSNGKKFLCGDVWGTFGYMFSDLGVHEYSEEIVQHKAVKRGPDEENKITKETVTTTVKKEITFVPFKNVLSTTYSKPELLSHIRYKEPSFFVFKLLLEFRDEHNRDPDPSKRVEDSEILSHKRDEFVKKFSLPSNFISDDILENVFGILSDSAAVVGAVISQEVVKAATQSEPPHDNMFFFNPEKFVGFVERIG